MAADERAVWLEDDVLPPLPSGAPYGSSGWVEPEGAHATWEPAEVADALARDADRRIELAWRSDGPRATRGRVAPVHEVFPDAALSRDAAHRSRRAGPNRRAVLLSAVLIVGLVVFFAQGGHLPPLIVLGVLLFGMSPFERAIDYFEDRLAERLYRRDPAELARRYAARTRYILWVRRQGRSPSGIGLVVTFGALSALQAWVGLSESVEIAGLVKPRVLDEPYRLLTAAYLHGGLLHLALNGLMTLMMARVLEPLIGTGRVLWIFLLGAIAGNLASTWLIDAPSLGASGGIMAFVGALAGLAARRVEVRRVGLQRIALRILVLMTIAGLVGVRMIDNAAHGGGALGGAVLGALFAPVAGRAEVRRVLSPFNLVAMVVALLPALLAAALLSRALH